jgi:alkylation response protein AidB-like acyl-CoA dehydrogenase
MSKPLTREQVEDLIVCMNAPETDGVHYAKFYRELMAHDATLRQQLAEVTAHLEAQRTATYQAVAREHEAKQQLATVTAERDEALKKARWKHTHDDSLELELQKQLAASVPLAEHNRIVTQTITALDAERTCFEEQLAASQARCAKLEEALKEGKR